MSNARGGLSQLLVEPGKQYVGGDAFLHEFNDINPSLTLPSGPRKYARPDDTSGLRLVQGRRGWLKCADALEEAVVRITLGVCLMTLATMADAGYVRGLATCSEWSKARIVESPRIAEGSEAEVALIYEAWLVGFLSGIAMQRDTEVLKGVDVSSIYLDVDEYCRDHPGDTTAQAGRDHMRELEERAGVLPKAVKK